MYKFRFILVPLMALVLCQIIKFIIESIINKKLMFERLFNGSGGMPSTHATFSVSLTTLIGYECDITSPIFAMCLIFTLIVLYDAIGVRYETGLQATVLNDIANKLDKKKHLDLKEKIGHKPLEVFCGVILGFLISTIFVLITL